MQNLLKIEPVLIEKTDTDQNHFKTEILQK